MLTFAHWDLYAKLPYPAPESAQNLTLNGASSGQLSRVGVGFSNHNNGSEGTLYFNCFGGWSGDAPARGSSPSEYVSFKVTFDKTQKATLKGFNFDATGFGVEEFSDPDRIGIQLYKNGSLVFADNSVLSGLATTGGNGISWKNVTASFESTGTSGPAVPSSNFASSLGSTDMFEVRLFAHDIPGAIVHQPRIGLDNVRFIGMVPEPSSAALLALGMMTFLGRRRRS